jgi:glycosyltransferase involved in cell wall biosynthesis
VRRIYFATGESFHSLYNELLQYPPSGYEFVVHKRIGEKEEKLSVRQVGVKALKSTHMLPYFRTLSWYSRWRTGAFLQNVPDDMDLVYSANRLFLNKKPWVLATEHLGDLCPVIYDLEHLSLYKMLIENVLNSRYCKKIIPYLNIGKTTLLKNLNCKYFEGKIEVVHLGIHPKNFVKEHESEKVTFLFVGTANVSNIPGSFEVRGGKELLEAFSILNKKYDNLELILRAKVPDYIRSKYSSMLGSKNVKIVDGVLPFEQFDQVMKSADILIFPGYITPAMTLLDAMSYELPVIATNIEGIPEMVTDNRNGFLIERKDNTPYTSMCAGKALPNLNDLARNTLDTKVVNGLIEKTSILIENKALRQKMGKDGRKEVEKGKFSLEKRNEKLKRIFDEAIND